jgi:hypothetical protein
MIFAHTIAPHYETFLPPLQVWKCVRNVKIVTWQIYSIEQIAHRQRTYLMFKECDTDLSSRGPIRVRGPNSTNRGLWMSPSMCLVTALPIELRGWVTLEKRYLSRKMSPHVTSQIEEQPHEFHKAVILRIQIQPQVFTLTSVLWGKFRISSSN